MEELEKNDAMELHLAENVEKKTRKQCYSWK